MLELLPGQGRLVDVPVVTPEGLVVVAWQKYQDQDAALMVLDIAAFATPASDDGSPSEVTARAAAPDLL